MELALAEKLDGGAEPEIIDTDSVLHRAETSGWHSRQLECQPCDFCQPQRRLPGAKNVITTTGVDACRIS